jgi:hypothetical protein
MDRKGYDRKKQHVGAVGHFHAEVVTVQNLRIVAHAFREILDSFETSGGQVG